MSSHLFSILSEPRCKKRSARASWVPRQCPTHLASDTRCLSRAIAVAITDAYNYKLTTSTYLSISKGKPDREWQRVRNVSMYLCRRRADGMWRGARWRALLALAGAALLLGAVRRMMGGGGGGVGGAQRASSEVPGRELPLIFIGGVPRSGTTLMRAMLDAHPDVRCGQETRVVPRILQMRQHWMRSQKEVVRLEQAGVSKTVLDNAIAAFCLEVIVRHGEPAPRLCNKDPLVLKMGTYVLDLFPNAKFLFMVRDGRATVHSIISRQVNYTRTRMVRQMCVRA